MFSSLSAQFPFGGNKKKTIKGKITGELIDSVTMSPVSFASISLKKAGKEKLVDGVLSGDDGKFKLSDVKTGKYDVYINFLGYKEKQIKDVELTLKDPDYSIDKIYLISDSYVLDAVEVVDQRSLIENKVDKLVYNVEQDATVAGGDATEVLRKVPLLSVDLEGNVSLRGSQNVKILINGKPSGMFSNNVADALKMFPADQIKKVEVITSPGAKYDGEGSAGIINIITKKENIEGIAGSINASAGTRQNSLFANLNAGKGRFGFSSGGAMFYSVPTDAVNTFYRESDFAGGTAIVDQSGNTETSRLGFNGSASAFYDFNAFNSLNTSITYRGFGFDLVSDIDGSYSDPSGLLNDSFNRDNIGETLFSGYDWNTDYTKKFADNEGQELTLAGQISGNIQNQDYEVKELHDMTLLNRNENVFNDGDNLESTFQIDYVHPFPKSLKLETGIKSVLRNIDSDYTYENFDEASNQYILDLERSNIFKYDQNVYAAYTSLNFVLAKKYSFVTGLRYERTAIKGDFQNGEAQFENDYDNFLPSIAISRSLPKFRNIKLAYSKRIQRPSLYYINPFTNNVDRVNITIGNPELAPELTHQIELSYNTSIAGFTIYTSTYYKRTNDVIEQILSVNEQGISENTFENIGHNNAFGLNLFTSKSLKRLTVRGGFNVFTYDATGEINGETLSNQALEYNVFMNGDYAITGSFKADFFGFFRSPRRTLQGDSPSFSIFGIGLRKEFKNTSVGIRIIEPFRKNKSFNSNLEGSDFIQKTTFSLPFQSFGLNVRYKFGKVDFKERKSKIKNSDLKQGEGNQGGGGNTGQGGSGGGS
jgi:outer membrane receptor protein involved in Fe transport